ncbi:MAG: hypothetical protein CL583_17810 [Alteromonadaceae bacterium]|nr:hypothetical protein [Alteromonadaceae bacterium]
MVLLSFAFWRLLRLPGMRAPIVFGFNRRRMFSQPLLSLKHLLTCDKASYALQPLHLSLDAYAKPYRQDSKKRLPCGEK